MKKNLLSCLTLLMVMLVSGVASAQTNVTLPGKNIPAGLPIGAGAVTPKQSGHIYICVSDLRPIDLTYDVLGKHLPFDMGGWDAAWATDGQKLTSPTYNPGGLTPNELAYDGRNVFKASNTTIGTYIFTFTSTQDDFCGLDKDDVVWAIVHVLPDFSLNVTETWNKCEGTTLNTAATPSLIFNATALQVISNAGYALTQKVYDPPIPPTATTNTTHAGDVYITKPHAGLPAYPCNDSSHVVLTINVVDTVDITNYGGVDSVCVYNFPANVTNRTEMDAYFGLSSTLYAGIGTWTPASAIDWVAEFSTVGTSKTYTLTITAADTAAAHASCLQLGVITFTVKSVAKFDTTMRVDYSTCDATAKPRLNSFVPPMAAAIVEWVSLGTDPLAVAGGVAPNFPNGGEVMTPFTVGGGTNPNTGSPVAQADFSKFAKGNKYYFLYHMASDLGACYTGTVDTVSITVNLANTSMDGRLQTCKAAQTIDFAAALGLPATGVTWTRVSASAPAIDAVGKVTVLATTPRNVYKYTYSQPSSGDGCGGGSGVFYLKVTDNITAMEEVKERFCHLVLPDYTNIYYLAGFSSALAATNPIAPSAATAAILATGAADYFDATTGVLDVSRLKNDLYPTFPATDVVLEFVIDDPGCGVGHPVTVQVILTNAI